MGPQAELPAPSEPLVRLYVVALSGDVAGLADTLQDLSQDAAVQVIGSDDEALRHCAAQAGAAYDAVLPSTLEPHCYWLTVLRAIEARRQVCPDEGACCALVIRAGCRLPPYASQRLYAVAQRTAASAVFPVAVRHPATSVFSATDHRPVLAASEVDRWLNHYATGLDFDIPVFAGYCALFRTIPSLVTVEDDAQLATAWRRQGAMVIGSDAVYVDDSALAPLALPATVYPAWRDSLLSRHPLTGIRHALTELSGRSEVAPPEVPPVRPVRLHVSHSWGGGLGRWVEDFVAADDSHQSLVLRPIGEWDAFAQTLALYPSAQMSVPLQTWTLTQPVLSTAIAHCQYQQIVQEIVATYGVASVMVSSLIGHSLDVLDTGLPTTFVCHDFYPACPPLYAAWETPCTSCDANRLTACIQSNPHHRIFRVEPADHWLALREAFVRAILERDIALVAPCRSVAQRLVALLPGLADKPVEIIEHGLSTALIANLAQARSRYRGAERLRIVILGSLAEHKGATLLMPVLSQITAFADLVLLGAGEDGRRFKNMAGVTVLDRYERDGLGALLAEYSPDLGLLLSTVPETFSYTLSELHAAGVPVAATALGAFADRIEHRRNGWLFEPQAEALLALLEQLHQTRDEIDAVRNQVLAIPARESATMVADYRCLENYRRLESKSGGTAFTPLQRPHTARRSMANHVAHGHLHIDHQAPYRQVLKDFIRYTAGKVQRTERLPRVVKKVVGAVLGRLT